MSKYDDLKKIVYGANMELPRHDVVIYTFGNVSALERDLGVFAIKPNGVSYQNPISKDMVVVDLENNVVEGNLRPSFNTKTHTVLYRNFSKIGDYSTYAVAWAQAMKSISIFDTTHADHLATIINKFIN